MDTNKQNITIENEGTFGGDTEWSVSVDGEWVADLVRTTPSRWHANGVSGLVLDREAPKEWTCIFSMEMGNGHVVRIPNGTSAHEAKRLVREAINKKEN